jgi:hypothetical protein
MINIHLNGDIIRCPDISEIKKRLNEVRDSHNICRYNMHEDNCEAWQQSLINWQSVKRNSNCGRCMLGGSISCPGHLRQTETGKKEKSFKIDNVNYRKLSSSAHYLVKKSVYKTLFITLSFPKFKTKYNESQINQCFSKFMENLRANYNCTGYVAVRERGRINNRYHFHLLCSIPFTDFAILNSAWCSAISDICHYSKNAVTSDKKTLFIRNPGRALRYVCKYFAKSKGQYSQSRIIFISNNLVKRPVKCYSNPIDFLKGYKSIQISQTSEWSTAYRITDTKEFDRFCNEFLYELFDIYTSNSELYSFHPG